MTIIHEQYPFKMHQTACTDRYTDLINQHIAKSHQNQQKEITAYAMHGITYLENKQFQKAIAHFQDALQIATKRDDKENEIAAYLSLAQAYQENHQMDRQLSTLRKL